MRPGGRSGARAPQKPAERAGDFLDLAKHNKWPTPPSAVLAICIYILGDSAEILAPKPSRNEKQIPPPKAAEDRSLRSG